MLLRPDSPAQQQFGGKRQLGVDLLVDGAEARNQVDEQEQDHHGANGQEQRGIGNGAQQLALQPVKLLAVGQVAPDHPRQVAGSFPRADGCDKQGREVPGLLGKCLRKAFPIRDAALELLEIGLVCGRGLTLA
ncbi:hypothetical protein D9M68_663060 [compost metagenome]